MQKAKERAAAIREYRHLVRRLKKSRTMAEYQDLSYRAEKLKTEYNL